MQTEIPVGAQNLMLVCDALDEYTYRKQQAIILIKCVQYSDGDNQLSGRLRERRGVMKRCLLLHLIRNIIHIIL